MHQVKRLYRNDDDKMIFGVCSGLGDYFEADPTLMRVLTIILFFISAGGALIGYIILAIVVPSKSSLIAKGEMPSKEKKDPKHDYTIDPDDYKL